jgi:hypothetical protein
METERTTLSQRERDRLKVLHLHSGGMWSDPHIEHIFSAAEAIEKKRVQHARGSRSMRIFNASASTRFLRSRDTFSLPSPTQHVRWQAIVRLDAESGCP